MKATITCGKCGTKAGKVTSKTINNISIYCPKCRTLLVKGN